MTRAVHHKRSRCQFSSRRFYIPFTPRNVRHSISGTRLVPNDFQNRKSGIKRVYRARTRIFYKYTLIFFFFFVILKYYLYKLYAIAECIAREFIIRISRDIEYVFD